MLFRSDAINHDPAHMFMNTGSQIAGRPSMGAWATYGLGTVNENLPAYVVLDDPKVIAKKVKSAVTDSDTAVRFDVAAGQAAGLQDRLRPFSSGLRQQPQRHLFPWRLAAPPGIVARQFDTVALGVAHELVGARAIGRPA